MWKKVKECQQQEIHNSNATAQFNSIPVIFYNFISAAYNMQMRQYLALDLKTGVKGQQKMCKQWEFYYLLAVIGISICEFTNTLFP